MTTNGEIICDNQKDTAELASGKSDRLPLRTAAEFEYEFVSGLDKSYSSRTRKLVLRRHFSKRRKTSKTQTTKLDTRIPNLESAKLLRRPPSIQTLISEIPADPFKSLPIDINKRQFYLLQHYLHLKGILFGHTHGSFDPFRDIVNEFALKNEVVLWGVLAVASSNLAKSYNRPETLESLNHCTQMVKSLNRQLSILSDDHAYDSAIIVTMFLYHIYIFLKTQKTEVAAQQDHSNLYITGLRQLIISQGGLMISTRSYNAFLTILNLDLQTGGEVSAGLVPISDHILSMPIVKNLTYKIADVTLIPQNVQELLGFYTNMYNQAIVRSRKPPKSNIHTWEELFAPQEQRQYHMAQLFQPGTRLHWFLTQCPRRPWWKGVAAIIYLNSVLWDYRNHPAQAVESFLESLRRMLVHEGLDYGGSLETFINIMGTLCRDVRLEYLPRIWLMTRLVRAIRGINPILQKRLEDSLMSFLMASSETDADGNFDWQPEDFVKDVLEDLEIIPRRN